MIAVSGLRYYLLLDAETADARMRSQTELRQLAHYLIPGLRELSVHDDQSGIAQLLAQEIRANPEIAQLGWQNQVATQIDAASASHAPRWFARLILLRAETMTHQVKLSGERIGILRLQTTPVPAIDNIWRKVQTQLKISGAIFFIIFFLLGLILRANSLTLKRLGQATARFKKGQHSVRMDVHGNAEAQALATTFNDLAQEVQTLLVSLQQSQREKS
ncbi:MAG: HAMP domain-containing protein [Undibacterium sp.]|nr:HAMP domain-containing protein [Undibacterium sp.]